MTLVSCDKSKGCDSIVNGTYCDQLVLIFFMYFYVFLMLFKSIVLFTEFLLFYCIEFFFCLINLDLNIWLLAIVTLASCAGRVAPELVCLDLPCSVQTSR